jgi:NAD(P) transhydrogenase subunit beta
VTEAARSLAYLVAALLFIGSLRGLSTQESARRGNAAGIVGMVLAVVATLVAVLMNLAAHPPASGGIVGRGALIAVVIAMGAVVGAVLAARVAMTAMPELVAMLHSFVGAAAVLVGVATYLDPQAAASGGNVHLLEIYIGVLVGAVTFSGSVVAFAKLRGLVGSKPLLLPGRHALNAGIVLACIALAVLFIRAPGAAGLSSLLVQAGLALALGVLLVAAIGGGDMPVVVSLLNSYSGWAAAAAGFMLDNDLLIVTGALVGSSGAILSAIMCRAMNRSIWNVVFGGFGADAPKGGKGAASQAQQPVHEASAEQVAQLLLAARSVIIVPGYGMAVAQAQHPVQELSSALRARGTNVRFAIHPVAGRLPGHMNVLLAEANVSYEIVEEMDEINGDFPTTDVVLVIGANDIVNPSALDDAESPIYGMPVLEVWKASRVVMLKRGMAAGYAGVENPLCWRPNTLMLFGDAKKSVQALLDGVRKG